MKRITLFSIFPIILWTLSLAAADSSHSGKINLSGPVTVSGTQLEPGDYVVRWTAIGPDTQIKFLRNGVEVASATGTVLQGKNATQSVTTDSGENGSRVLSQIRLSKVTLEFTPAQLSKAD